MKSLAKYLAVCLIGLGCAQAQSLYPVNAASADNTLGTSAPYRGVYFDGKTPGSAIRIDVGTSGKAIVSLYVYTAAGTPAWYTTQGTFIPSDEVTRWTTGVIGSMTTDPFPTRTVKQCPSCVPISTNAPSGIPGSALLTWVNSREVKMTAGTTTWDFVAPNLDTGNDADYLAGTWAATFVISFAQPGNNAEFHHHNAFAAPLQMIPTPNPIVIAVGSEKMTNYPKGAQAYVASCGIVAPDGFGQPREAGFDTLCQWFNGSVAPSFIAASQTGNIIFWYDKSTNRFGVDVCVLQLIRGVESCVIGPNGFHYDLYLEGSNSLFGRGMVQGSQPSNGVFVNGQLGLSLSMTKLPGPSTTQ